MRTARIALLVCGITRVIPYRAREPASVEFALDEDVGGTAGSSYGKYGSGDGRDEWSAELDPSLLKDVDPFAAAGGAAGESKANVAQRLRGRALLAAAAWLGRAGVLRCARAHRVLRLVARRIVPPARRPGALPCPLHRSLQVWRRD